MPRPAVIQFTSPGRIACSEPTLSRCMISPSNRYVTRRQADVRMRPHVDAARNARRETHRAEMVEEDERPDHPPLGEGKHAADVESAEVAAALRR